MYISSTLITLFTFVFTLVKSLQFFTNLTLPIYVLMRRISLAFCGKKDFYLTATWCLLHLFLLTLYLTVAQLSISYERFFCEAHILSWNKNKMCTLANIWQHIGKGLWHTWLIKCPYLSDGIQYNLFIIEFL